jgi:hypothetical protein
VRSRRGHTSPGTPLHHGKLLCLLLKRVWIRHEGERGDEQSHNYAYIVEGRLKRTRRGTANVQSTTFNFWLNPDHAWIFLC